MHSHRKAELAGMDRIDRINTFWILDFGFEIST
jgi:hypothetical protein